MSRRIIAAAVALDLGVGEPTMWHPVRGMGRLIDAFRKAERTQSGARARTRGALFMASSTLACAAVVQHAARRVYRLPEPLRTPVLAALLKPTFAIRALLLAARRVESALHRCDLVAARQQLGRHLVSRPTHDLTASEVAAAAIESIAENLTDSIVAPLMYYALGGVSAAYAYRFINTADAMLGYRTPELEAPGWAAAKSDDIANYVPARIAALLIAISAPVAHGSTRNALRVMARDASLTASPNAGWTMAAAAGALGVRLEKRGAYRLNAAARPAELTDLRRGLRLISVAAGLAVALVTVLCGEA